MSALPPARKSYLSWFAIWWIPSGKYGFGRTVLVSSVILLLSLAGYAATYWYSVKITGVLVVNPSTMTAELQPKPWYNTPPILPSSAGRAIEMFFEPAHQVDCRIRPDVWSPKVVPYQVPQAIEVLPEVSREELNRVQSVLGDSIRQGIGNR